MQLISSIDASKFPSNVVKEYYDVVRELMGAILLLDGFKTYGEGAHKKLIEYLDKNYEQFAEHEIALIDELRITRNKIAYDGFFVTPDYLERNKQAIEEVIAKLKRIVYEELGS